MASDPNEPPRVPVPDYRPIERFWPYVDLPEQPSDRELAALSEGTRVRHRARFFPQDAARLRDLFGIVGRFDATDVLVDDRPVPYARELWLPLFWFLIR